MNTWHNFIVPQCGADKMVKKILIEAVKSKPFAISKVLGHSMVVKTRKRKR